MEHNKYCVTVHFRNCEPQYWESVITTVEAFMQTRENLKATRGRKVLEIKPQVVAGLQGLGRTANLGEADLPGPATRGSIAPLLCKTDPAGSFLNDSGTPHTSSHARGCYHCVVLQPVTLCWQ